MINLLYNLKKLNKIKSRSKKPSLETIPENKVLYTTSNITKKESLNTLFITEQCHYQNKKT